MPGHHIRRFLANLHKFTPLGVIQRLILKLSGKTVVVRGSCHHCGTCCRKINLEGQRGWLRTEKEFQRIVQRYPEYKRFRIMGRDEYGFLLFSCRVLNDMGLCDDYEKRPSICRTFPDPTLYYSGGRVPIGCGYHFQISKSFQPFLKKALKEEDEKKR